MDPALLREREAFRKKALNAPLVEARKRPAEPEQSKSRPSKKVKSEKEKPPSRGRVLQTLVAFCSLRQRIVCKAYQLHEL